MGATIGEYVNMLLGLLLLPFYALFVWFDMHFPQLNPFLKFQRNGTEIFADPAAFFAVLKRGKIPQDAELVSLERAGALKDEPLKNGTSCQLTLKYKTGSGAVKTVQLFVKFQTERGTPVLIKAMQAAFERYHREVMLYNVLAKELPVRVPECVVAVHSRLFQRVLIVLELVPPPFATVPDWKGASPSQIGRLMEEAGSLHAQYWRQNVDPTVAPYLQNRVGLKWISAIDLFLRNADPAWKPWFVPLWTALKEYFAKNPRMTLSHGDCRPGNMMFNGDEIILTDWEAVGFTPFMWDFTYCTVLGQTVEVRRKLRSAQLTAYLAHLRRKGVPESDCTEGLATIDMHLLGIVIWYYGWLLQQVKGVGKEQGNSDNDMLCWTERIHHAVVDGTTNVPEIARILNVSPDIIQGARDNSIPYVKHFEEHPTTDMRK